MRDAPNIVEKYTVNTIAVTPNFDGMGYFPQTSQLKPLDDFNFVHEVLDVMTAAAEAGVLNRETWVNQIFANSDVFRRFMDELANYDEYCRIHDRWYRALFEIINAVNEEGFVLCHEIVERMLEQVERTKQIEQ